MPPRVLCSDIEFITLVAFPSYSLINESALVISRQSLTILGVEKVLLNVFLRHGRIIVSNVRDVTQILSPCMISVYRLLSQVLMNSPRGADF